MLLRWFWNALREGAGGSRPGAPRARFPGCIPALLGLGLLLSRGAFALPNENAKVLIHLQPPVPRETCTRPAAAPACDGIVVSGDLSPVRYFAYVLVTDALACDGVSGVQFGIDYDGLPGHGVDVLDWSGCASVVAGTADWPAAGSGMRLSWNVDGRCQRAEPGGAGTGVVAVAGYFYVTAYSPGRLAIVPHPDDGLVMVADCAARQTVIEERGRTPVPSPLGYAAFSAGGAIDLGYNPCGAMIHPLRCEVSGTSPVVAGSTHAYALETNGCPEAILWSLSDPGEIVGSATGPTVQVRALSGGVIVLGVSFTAGGGVGGCTRGVEVTEPPPPPPLECVIRGPSTVPPGSTTFFDASYQSGATYTWSVTGSGALAGPTSGSGADVVAGSPGSFTVHLQVSRGPESETCSKTVTVAWPSEACAIRGPDQAFEGPARCFFDGGEYPGASYEWSLVGNGTIIGSSAGRILEVEPGRYWFGTFWLNLKVDLGGRELTCLKMITVLQAPEPAPEGRNAGARVLVHLASPATERPCAGAPAGPRCRDIATQGELYPARSYYAMVLVTNGVTDGTASSGVGGVQFGIEYNGVPGSGVDIFDFTVCGLLQMPTAGWPRPGSGNRILWDGVTRCQRAEPDGPGTGVTAAAGYFYLAAYTPDELSITTYPQDGTVQVFDCLGAGSVVVADGQLKAPWPLGRAAFSADGLSPGYNPCGGGTPVERTTWSRVKALYRD